MCWNCGAEQDFSKSVYRNSTCSRCGADLHSCRGCSFYAPENHFGCRETVDQMVVEKDRANFCDFFRAGKNSKWTNIGFSAKEKGAAAALSAASLFGDPSLAEGACASADKARDAFASLFG